MAHSTKHSVGPAAKWRKVQIATAPSPLPRHGHRAVAIKDLMVVFGGGNEGIVNELYVFDTAAKKWFKPIVRGEQMPGLAAFGMDSDGETIYIFGGMISQKNYSDVFYKLVPKRWEYSTVKIRAPQSGEKSPCARLGHSMNIDSSGICYIFGGMTRDEDDSIKYLDDLYSVDLETTKQLQYKKINISGPSPSARESHTASLYEYDDQKFLYLYGGMNGERLGDIWILDLVHFVWRQIDARGTIPLPRSLHSANIIKNRLYIFGGWVPVYGVEDTSEGVRQNWKCSNDLLCYHVVNEEWESFDHNIVDENGQLPRPRAGHSTVVINNRIYIWSGRDGVRKLGTNQICCKDMYYLETDIPSVPQQPALVKSGINSLEFAWGASTAADSYVTELKRVGRDNEAHASQDSLQRRLAPQAQNGGHRVKRFHIPSPQNPALPRQSPQYRQISSDGRVFVRAQNPVRIVSQPPQNGQQIQEPPQYSLPAPTYSAPLPAPAPAPVEQQLPANFLEDNEEGPSESKEEKPLTDPASISLEAPKLDSSVEDPASISLDLKPEDVKEEEKKTESSNEKSEDQEALSTEPKEQSEKEVKDEEKKEEPVLSSQSSQSALPSVLSPVQSPEKVQNVTGQENEQSEEKKENPSASLNTSLSPTKTFIAPLSPPKPLSEPEEWHYVDEASENSTKVTYYFVDTVVNGERKRIQTPLEQGFIYQFRVAAKNACGQSDWSNAITVKTCVPGFPGAPSSIKITKGVDGCHLSWEPPTNPNGQIVEYSVYLAMKQAVVNDKGESNSFLKVYNGIENHCQVAGHILSNALVDAVPKPAVIFRIAAKNQKGYGPATQVRWLQENRLPALSAPSHATPRLAPSQLAHPSYTKRLRID